MSSTPPIRKRMKRREIPGGTRFITFSCERRLPLLGHEAIRDLFAAVLSEARAEFGFELYAWVVMPEHVHLLVRPRLDSPLDRALVGLKLRVCRRVLSRWRQIDAPILTKLHRPNGTTRFWQPGGGFDRNVRDEGEFGRTVRYVHRNPVERGLVERADDWRASSVRWWMGEREREVECDDPPGGAEAWREWTGFA